jgi:hypothetical protein
MEMISMSKNRIYNTINLVTVVLFLCLVMAFFVLNSQQILIGVLIRGVFALLIIFNAVYLVFTKQPSFLLRKGQERHRILMGVLLLTVGLFTLITACLGYGINGYPRLK